MGRDTTKTMKLLFENWRKYISEDDEEEEEKTTTADKIKNLFMHNALQAHALACGVGTVPELVSLMETALNTVHKIMESFRGAANAKSQAEAMKVPPVRGLYEQFEQAMEKIYGRDLIDSSVELHDIEKSIYDLYNSAFVAREYFGERHTDYIRRQATNLKAYKFAAEWAGTSLRPCKRKPPEEPPE